MTDLTWALSSCALILAAIALRAAFGKRMRPGLRYALWGLVLLRLLIPAQLFAAPWGVSAELPERMTRKSIGGEVYARIELPTRGFAEDGGAAFASEEDWETWERFVTRGTMPEGVPKDADMFALIGPEKAEASWSGCRYSVADILRIVWLAGVGATAAVFLVSNLCFYTRLRKRREPLDTACPLRVYAVEGLPSSCLFGNAVYVAAETAADETRLRHVLAHELSHHRHGDHIWTVLRCAALSLHWYDPLAWWAAALSRQDSELCADAGALRRLGEDERESYGATLIELSARRAARASLLCTATTMTNGKKSLRERVTMIAHSPRMTVPVVAAVVCIAAVVVICAFAGAKTEGAETVRWDGDRDLADSVTLWSAGQEITAEEPESVRQLLDAIGDVVFTPGGDANEPGARSLTATIRYRDGTEERVTFPCWERDGVTYDAGADSVIRFAPFFADRPEPREAESETELLLRALRGELAFPLDTSHTRSYTLPEREFTLSELTAEDTETTERAAYAFLDLDGDGAEEAVYRRGDYRGFYVLRVWEGRVYGYELNYRDMTSLKRDGTFGQSAGATDNGCGRMVFIGKDMAIQDFMWLREGSSGASYTVENKEVGRDEYYRAMAAQDAKPDALWHELAPAERDAETLNCMIVQFDPRRLGQEELDALGAKYGFEAVRNFGRADLFSAYFDEPLTRAAADALSAALTSEGGIVLAGSLKPYYDDIMGFADYNIETEELAPNHYLCRYTAEIDGGTVTLAESFGFACDDHIADLDGDGVTELVCNCVYGGDGARRVFVYRRNGDVIERGGIDYDKLDLAAWDDWGANSTAERYDPASGRLLVEYASLASSSGDGSTSGTFIREVGYEDFSWAEYARIAG